MRAVLGGRNRRSGFKRLFEQVLLNHHWTLRTGGRVHPADLARFGLLHPFSSLKFFLILRKIDALTFADLRPSSPSSSLHLHSTQPNQHRRNDGRAKRQQKTAIASSASESSSGAAVNLGGRRWRGTRRDEQYGCGFLHVFTVYVLKNHVCVCVCFLVVEMNCHGMKSLGVIRL